MANKDNRNVVVRWCQELHAEARASLSRQLRDSLTQVRDRPLEAMLATAAAAVMAACAEDLGLSSVELASLLREPRQDALAGLLTVVSDS